MQTFNILDPKTNIFQNRCLEASAGTGKTFAIEHLFVRFLLESDPPISLSQILAVTFTRDATREMKSRIRKNLEEVQKSLEGEKTLQWPYLEKITLRAEALKRTKDALIQIDELQIFTIHGFCHRMLHEFSMQANMSLVAGSPDQFHHESSMRTVVEDFLRSEQSAFCHDLSILLSKMRYDVGRLIQVIIKEMQKQETEVEKMDWQHVFSSLIEPNFHIPSFTQDFLKMASRYKRLNPEQFLPQVEHLGLALKSRGKEGISKLLQQKNWVLEKMHEENVKVKAPSLETLSLTYPRLFSKLQNILLPKLLEATDAQLCLKRIGQQCRRLWNIKNLTHEQLAPDDLLRKMELSLKREDFAELIRKKYRSVIVDEFQDTDPIQWNIFRKLFLQSDSIIYLVGDPKQSIYGFRSADIYTYMRAIEELGQEKKALLDTNFRSSPKLIDALNAFFTKIPNWLALPTSNNLLYHPVKAGRTSTNFQETPMQFFLAEGEQSREKTWPPKSVEEKKLFPFMASEMIRLKEAANIPFGEMAILVKDRYQARRMQDHLRKWNIPAVIQKSVHLKETKGFFVIEQLLQTAVSLSEDSLKSFLLLIGFSKEELEKNPQQFRRFLSLFSSLREVKFEVFYPQFMEAIIQNHETSFLSEFTQIAELLIERPFSSPEDHLSWLRSLQNVSIEEDPHLQLRGEEKGDKVKIMTIFASKGLEFEVVFALGVASCSFSEENEEEKESEKMRELYVALTRAREKLYIPFVFHEGDKGNSALDIFFGKLGEFPIVKDQVVDFINELSIEMKWLEEIPIKPLAVEQIPNNFSPSMISLPNFPHKSLASFSSLSTPISNNFLQDMYLSQDLNEKTLHTLPLGSETGVIIHAIFEQIFLDRKQPISLIVQKQIRNSPLVEWNIVVEKMAEEILKMPLLDAFALKDLVPGNYFQEMEFLYSEGNQFIKGFADLVFQHDGKYYLLDWKTNWLGIDDEDYNQENMEKAMVQHDYFLQAKLYAEALKRYVKLFDTRPFEDLLGGAIYIFLRGKKAYYLTAYEMDRSNIHL